MGRPRRFDPDELADHARSLWVEHGKSGVTTRALVAASGASNGAVYHAFGSRDGLLARVWARETAGFLTFQQDAVSRAMSDGGAVDGLVEAALAPARYAETAGLTDEGRSQLRRRQQELGSLLAELSTALWRRQDTAALTTVRYCVVDLPGALLLRSPGITDPIAHHALELAVRGIAAEPPPC